MKFIYRLPRYLTGLTVIGAALAWVIALFSGFSSTYIICWGARSVGSCEMSSSPYWTASTVLWLGPLVIFLILGAWALITIIIPKSFPMLIGSLVMLILFILLAIFVMSQAAGNSA